MSKQTLPEYQAKVEEWYRRYPEATYEGLQEAARLVERSMQTAYSGGVVRVLSGDLARSVKSKLSRQPLRAVVDVDDRQQYKAQTLEAGGVHTPRRKPYMRFLIAGRWVRMKKTVHPAFAPAEKAYNQVRARIPQIILDRIIADVYEQ